MEITRRTRRAPKAVVGELADVYPHDVQLYKLPPMFTIVRSEFDYLTVERLKLLRIIDAISLQKCAKYSDDWRKAIISDIKKHNIKCFPKITEYYDGTGQTENDIVLRKNDHISHYLLRLCYCNTDDMRRWFLSREIDLFRLRFLGLSPKGVNAFFKENGLNYSPISQSEKADIKDQLYNCTPGLSAVAVETQDFYKVHFTEVLDLVRNRRVYLSKGYAFIPSSDLVSVVVSIFRASLSQALVQTFRHLPEIQVDERMKPLLKNLHTSYTGEDYLAKRSNNEVHIEDLDKLAVTSFPLCMRQLHERLKSAHHLKHGGRMQYCLFLKGIGLSMESALRFWRQEFTKAMDGDKWDKQYAYLIRHNYGKEGKRVNYTPYSCMKIILNPVGPGDAHGCPFKHNDLAALRQQLLSYNIPVAGIQEVLDSVAKGHYQIACAKYFEITHKATIDSGVHHPNKYFEESQKIMSGRRTVAADVGSPSVVSKKTVVKKEDVWDSDIDVNSLDFTKLENDVKME